LVIVDANDKTIDCETKDLPGARRLIVGRYALVRAKGEFGLRLPAGRRFFNLTENLKIPIGSTIDPNDSVVTLATARNRSGARQVALVSGGRFTVRQRGDRRPVTELRLAGAPPDCPVASRRQGVAKRRPPRKLDVEIGKRNSVAAIWCGASTASGGDRHSLGDRGSLRRNPHNRQERDGTSAKPRAQPDRHRTGWPQLPGAPR
jgi:hypothetical protein